MGKKYMRSIDKKYFPVFLWVILFFSTLTLGCDVVPYHKTDINEILNEISSEFAHKAIVKNALATTSASYKPQAIEKLQRFLVASDDIAKNNQSTLIKRLDYPIDVPVKSTIQETDNVVIIIDSGFSDAFLTYANDIIAYYEIGSDGHLNARKLDFILPRWAWYLYELQADAGNPFRVLQEFEEMFPNIYTYNNLLENTSFLDIMKNLNSKSLLDNTLFYQGNFIEANYHGALVTYTLKEWAPSAKLIFVRDNYSSKNKTKENTMLRDLDKIAKKYNAEIIIRSSMDTYYWHGLNKDNLLKDQIIVNAALDKPVLANKFAQSKPNITAHNFVFANTFSSGCKNLRLDKNGATFSLISSKLHEIENISFFQGRFDQSMLDYSSVFVDRHVCSHIYNLASGHTNCLSKEYFTIGFNYLGGRIFPCPVRPVNIGGDSSSAAPLVAAWAMFIKNKANLKTVNQINAEKIANYINGFREPNQAEPYMFQDPIAYDQFPIFEEGYGNGLIIPKKFADY